MDKTREQAVKDTVGRIIKRIRESKNWSKSDLARICEVTHATIAGWERGINLPPAGLMVELAKILVDGTPNDLYGIAPSELTLERIFRENIDLKKLILRSSNLTFDGLPIPNHIKESLVKNIRSALEMAGISKKNIVDNKRYLMFRLGVIDLKN